MSDQLPRSDVNENDVTVRYWASARSAAGIAEEKVSARTLAELLDEISRRHGHRDRFDDVIASCAILISEVPVGAREPAEMALQAGDSIEFLPPFAGG